MSKYKAIILVGLSSSGKDTLYNKLLSLNLGFKETISHTTRPKRIGESDSVYHFISNEKFDELITNNEFIETRTYQTEDLWRYGLSKQALDNNKNDTSLIIVDLQGLKQLENYLGKDNIYSIYLSVSPTTRLIRSINRQKIEIEREFASNRDDETLQELIRRYRADKKDFAKANQLCNITLKNETPVDLENNIAYIKNLIR